MSTINIHVPQSMTTDLEFLVLVSQAVQQRFPKEACGVQQDEKTTALEVLGPYPPEVLAEVRQMVDDLFKLHSIGGRAS